MGVKFARAFGADVVVFTTSPGRRTTRGGWARTRSSSRDGRRRCTRTSNSFDLILDTVAAPHDLNAYLDLLRRDGTMVLVGLPEVGAAGAAPASQPSTLIFRRRQLAGSLIGGLRRPRRCSTTARSTGSCRTSR